MVTAALDTNIVIAIFYEEASVLNQVDLTPEIFVPSIVIGELFYGAYNSDAAERNIESMELFASEIEIIQCDESTAQVYGSIKADLKMKGKMIPENDIWIAACAIQHDLALVSRDAHFENISSLKLLVW